MLETCDCVVIGAGAAASFFRKASTSDPEAAVVSGFSSSFIAGVEVNWKPVLAC